jgi:hypothetical protein
MRGKVDTRVPRQGFRQQTDGDFTNFTMKNEDLIIKKWGFKWILP